jgi:ubiquinone/menaquinone biosynthesis C-methylase UbiE/uncharacterized protein YbaR (Trm112 family)
MNATLIDPQLIEILCCPACRGELDYHAGRSEMWCAACSFTYPIVDGIPVLFPTDVKARFAELFQRSWDSEERAEVYDRFVEGRESLVDFYNHTGEVRATMDVLGPVPDSAWLLDCGCGNGRFFDQYPRHACVVGIDASLNLLRICKQKGRATRLVCGELEHLPFKSGVFDRTVCVRVLQHIRQQERAVAEMTRVLSGGGELVLHCYNDLSSKAFIKRIRQSRFSSLLNAPFRAAFRTMSPFAPWPFDYDRYNTVPQVRRWMRRNGLAVSTIRGAGFGFNKWLLADFLIAPWLERHRPGVLKGYLGTSILLERALGRLWPFNYVMEKFVVKGAKAVKAPPSSGAVPQPRVPTRCSAEHGEPG